ncbi:PREDICTED: psbP domain-containing protein 2, chloroplastic [Tarenaya hassleriana]|uniref:psbP domain-containing protein 2, chloroplastic n=1 Tax=Tarenaya hassleriana TaxID=28532 RepID=UPI00053C1123|nr:PREDICTED: psbP domain-containing protein 2, chloroplastic [Tarenaya hassleriana]
MESRRYPSRKASTFFIFVGCHKMWVASCTASGHVSPPLPNISQPLPPLPKPAKHLSAVKNPPIGVRLGRRYVNLSVLTLLFNGLWPERAKSVEDDASGSGELQRYTDSREGFTLLVPSSWIKVEKTGATVLFEQADKGRNNVGVVVNPVRIKSLAEFGPPQFVVDKLIQAEKRKESTKDAEVVSVAERTGKRGLPVYEFEYKLDSTRGGMKMIFSAAFVNSNKLYLLNISHSDQPDSPLDSRTRTMLEQILHSFDAVPLT